MKKKRKVERNEMLFLIFLLLFIIIFPLMVTYFYPVYAVDEGTVNFTALPNKMMERLLLPNLFVARVLTSLVITFIVLIPVAIFANFMITFITFQIMLIFCTAIGWLDGWVMMLDVFLVSGLFTFGFISKMFSKGK